MSTPYGDDEDDLKQEAADDLVGSYATPQYPTPSSSYHTNTTINSNKIIGYGILGCAAIASKIARAIHLAPNSQVTVVASRSLEKAQHFIQRNCPTAEAKTYDDLINSDNVDIVYIPIPTTLRLPWIVKAIEKKKHILCEKPVGSPKYVEVIIPSCRAKNVQFMDGVEFMHHPRFKELTEKIHKSKIIGNIQRVVSSCSVPCTDDENIRNQPDLEPLGALGDLGIHNIRLSLWAFDYETPRFVKAICHKYSKKTGSIQDCSVWLFFSSDRVASFDCSYHTAFRQHAELVGATGSINLRQFAIPNEKKCGYTIHYQTLNTYDAKEHIEAKDFHNCIQEVEMIKRMTSIAITSKTEQFWPSVSLVTEKILDACRRSMNKDGALVEYVRGQLWFEMANDHERKISMIGSNMHVATQIDSLK
eukprot:660562_1